MNQGTFCSNYMIIVRMEDESMSSLSLEGFNRMVFIYIYIS